MESLPYEIKKYELYKHLSYESLMRLCNTNKNFSHLCYDNKVWQFILKRDFGITDVNAKQTYYLYKEALNFLSNYYEIITLNALTLFVENIAPQYWHDFDNELLKDNDENIFFELKLIELIQNVIMNDDIIVGDVMTGNVIYNIDNHPFYYNGIEELIDRVYSKNAIYYKSLTDKIITKGCYKIKKYSKTPAIVFYNKQKEIVQYDIDIAFSLEFEASENGMICYQQTSDIKNLIMDELYNKKNYL